MLSFKILNPTSEIIFTFQTKLILIKTNHFLSQEATVHQILSASHLPSLLGMSTLVNAVPYNNAQSWWPLPYNVILTVFHIVSGWPGRLPDAMQALSHCLPPKKDVMWGENKMENLVGWGTEVKTGRSFTCHHHGQNWPNFGKMNLIYCQLEKSWMVRNKNRPLTLPGYLNPTQTYM